LHTAIHGDDQQLFIIQGEVEGVQPVDFKHVAGGKDGRQSSSHHSLSSGSKG
jgi:hypothetical protein